MAIVRLDRRLDDVSLRSLRTLGLEHHAVRDQGVDAVVVVTRLTQDLACGVADDERRARDTTGCFGEVEEQPRLVETPDEPLLVARDPPTLDQLGIVEHAERERVVGDLARNAGGVEQLEPIGRGTRRERVFERRPELGIVRETACRARESLVTEEIVATERLAQVLPVRVGDRREAEPARPASGTGGRAR